MRRENYVHYQCRHFDGFDFDRPATASLRNDAYVSVLPAIRGRVAARDCDALVRDWQVAEDMAGRPVKMTLPGPMTIADTTADEFYGAPAKLNADLARALNAQVLALAGAGCAHIQIDEPVFARKPQDALDYGIAGLEACFAGLPDGVTRIMHMCCGYPTALDDKAYPKADPAAYLDLADAVDRIVDQVSIEDAHRHNPPEVFGAFKTADLIVGFVRIADSRLEPVDEIAERMAQVLAHVPPARLIAAPDCGLGFLGRDLAMAKLRNLCDAAARV